MQQGAGIMMISENDTQRNDVSMDRFRHKSQKNSDVPAKLRPEDSFVYQIDRLARKKDMSVRRLELIYSRHELYCMIAQLPKEEIKIFEEPSVVELD